MTLELTYYNDPLLRKKCRPIENITSEVQRLAEELTRAVLAYDGAGLAAPQVGYDVRMFVIRYANGSSGDGMPKLCEPKIYINPTISAISEEVNEQMEACLSIPGIAEKVTRPSKISVEAMDQNGALFQEEATQWRARVILHENDHLNGRLFIDRLPQAKRKQLKSRLAAIDERYRVRAKK